MSFSCAGLAQKVTFYGNVKDSLNGEGLIGVNIYIADLKTGTTTNEYGFYSLSVPKGEYSVKFSYVGYITKTLTISVENSQKIDVLLEPKGSELQEVVVSSQRNENLARIETSVNRLNASTIKAIPALGEVDLIKAIQLLPGVQPVAEGSSNFSVRGGGYDQNLILLDEATIYSSSHLLGFFSIFNNDVIKDVQLYKGDIPASFGGRLSSLMDIRTKDGNNKRFGITGGVGTIASRLTLEGPIATEDVSFLVAARRTYADLFLKMMKDQNLRQSKLYFYDVNAKFNWKINDNNRIFLAGYAGDDTFANNMMGMSYGNQTGTLRWNSIFTSKLFFNLTLLVSNYNYGMTSSITDEMAFDWKSRLMDLGGKMDFTYMPNSKNTLKFGYQATYHTIFPGKGGGVGDNSLLQKYELPQNFSLEHAVYASHQTTLWKKLNLRYGLRFSMFHNIGNDNQGYIIEDYVITDSVFREKGKIYNTHFSLEPRVSLTYLIDNKNSLKASYSYLTQYMQVASNSAAGSPLDLWFSTSNNVKPQTCQQVVVGYFRNFWNNNLEASLEVYYKDFQNVVDFKERANLMGNAKLDAELRFGKGYSYGVELMVQKKEGKINGWVSYTYSRSFRKIDEVNDNEWFRSPFDKPHNISIVANYDITKKWSVAASWVYATGQPVTYPVGRYLIGDRYVPIPSKRNAYRFPDYHRLDVSATWKISKPNKRFQNELNLSIYNAYARKNPWTIYFRQEEDNPNKSYAEMIYLFSVVPSLTWNFSW